MPVMEERERVDVEHPLPEADHAALPEALIKEARQRQRRRRAAVALAIIATAAAVGFALFGGGGSNGSPPAPPVGSGSPTPVGAFDRATAHAGDTITVSFGAMPVSTSSPWSTHRSVLVSFTLLPLRLASRWWPIYNSYGFSWGPPPRLAAASPLGSGRISFATRHPNRYRVRIPANAAAGKYVLAYAGGGARWTSARPDWQVDPHGILQITPRD